MHRCSRFTCNRRTINRCCNDDDDDVLAVLMEERQSVDIVVSCVRILLADTPVLSDRGSLVHRSVVRSISMRSWRKHNFLLTVLIIYTQSRLRVLGASKMQIFPVPQPFCPTALLFTGLFILDSPTWSNLYTVWNFSSASFSVITMLMTMECCNLLLWMGAYFTTR